MKSVSNKIDAIKKNNRKFNLMKCFNGNWEFTEPH